LGDLIDSLTISPIDQEMNPLSRALLIKNILTFYAPAVDVGANKTQ
jgi:hypothetical protein